LCEELRRFWYRKYNGTCEAIMIFARYGTSLLDADTSRYCKKSNIFKKNVATPENHKILHQYDQREKGGA